MCQNGIAWFAAVTDKVLDSTKTNSNSKIDHLSNIYNSWHDPISTLIQKVDNQEDGIHIEDIYQSEMKYQGNIIVYINVYFYVQYI